jgi:hypothetical protein
MPMPDRTLAAWRFLGGGFFLGLRLLCGLSSPSDMSQTIEQTQKGNHPGVEPTTPMGSQSLINRPEVVPITEMKQGEGVPILVEK